MRSAMGGDCASCSRLLRAATPVLRAIARRGLGSRPISQRISCRIFCWRYIWSGVPETVDERRCSTGGNTSRIGWISQAAEGM